VKKRFLVFAGARWYPAGGWRDFASDHETLADAVEAARAAARDRSPGWADIVDTETWKIVHKVSYDAKAQY
jgi:hypothetical protein